MRWFFGSLLVLSGVIVGIVLGLAVPGLSLIAFTPTVDAGAVLNAVVILLVALLIEYAYHSHASSKQSDTELLLDLMKDAKSAFHTLKTCSECCDIYKKLTQDQKNALVSAERELSRAVESIEKALGYCKIKTHKLDFEKLKNARVELKDRLTDSPPFLVPTKLEA